MPRSRRPSLNNSSSSNQNPQQPSQAILARQISQQSFQADLSVDVSVDVSSPSAVPYSQQPHTRLRLSSPDGGYTQFSRAESSSSLLSRPRFLSDASGADGGFGEGGPGPLQYIDFADRSPSTRSDFVGKIKHRAKAPGKRLSNINKIKDPKEAGGSARPKAGKAERDQRSLRTMPRTPMQRFVRWATKESNHYIWLFLLVLGGMTALVGYIMDTGIKLLLKGRQGLLDATGSNAADNIGGIVIWVFYSLLLSMLAVGFTAKVGPAAAGSGIPEMKARLSGILIPNLLTWKTLQAKVVGLVAALGSGLSIGKEGPFIHVSSAMASLLLKFRLFKNIRLNEELSLQMLAAACAVGVSSNFGAPVGGVLFSIEVTATHYAVRNYWKGFLAAVGGGLCFRLLLSTFEAHEGALFSTSFPNIPYDVPELFLYLILGTVCGAISAAFVRSVAFVAKWRKSLMQKKHTFFKWPYPQTAVVSLATCLLSYPGFIGKFMGISQGRQFQDLMSELSLPEYWGTGSSMFIHIVVFSICKFALTVVSILMPVAAGVFAPSLIIGAGVGRLFGEVIALLFPSGITDSVPNIVAGGYAAVGAAAMAAGVTRTISAAVIVFEITGQLEHALPILVAVTASVAMGDRLSLSVFDALAHFKGLPYFIRTSGAHIDASKTVDDITASDCLVLERDASLEDIQHIVTNCKQIVVPIVDNKESLTLLGTVQLSALERFVETYNSSKRQNVNEGCFSRFLRGLQGEDEADEVSLLGHDDDETEMSELGAPRSAMFFQSKYAEVDVAPFEISSGMPLTRAFQLFSNLNLSHAVVVTNRKLKGIVTRQHIIQAGL